MVFNMRRMQYLFIFAIVLLVRSEVRGSSGLPVSLTGHWQQVGTIFRGTVVEVQAFRNPTNGMIYTRTLWRVDETYKGKQPPVVRLVQRGGEVGGLGMSDDLSPRFYIGEECVLFVARQTDGTLSVQDGHAGVVRLHRQATGGFAPEQAALLNKMRLTTAAVPASIEDVTDQAATVTADGFTAAPSGDSNGTSTNGLLTDNSGVPARWSQPDRGEPIPYLVDATYLPAGMTLTNALSAVSNAFAAWSTASSARFVFAGTTNLGQTAAAINANDGVIRVQLHDAYNFIPAGSILGEGGSYYTIGLLTNANWGTGGNVAGMEFNQSQGGFVVLKQTNSSLQTLTTFTEVLTHEIGHVLGLAHSSNVATNDPTLTNSVMFYLAHADGRGARLNSYDTNVVREAHPFNTPPYTYPRFMDITTSPYGAVTNIPGINQFQLRGYDLQSTNLVMTMTNATTGTGKFVVSNNIVSFVVPIFYGTPRLDPAGNSFYDIAYARFSDGTNASPYTSIKVLSHNPDYDAVSDGIPDAWMTNYFGHAAPQAGDKSRAGDDADGDKLTNLQEYMAGQNPKLASSAQRISLVQTNTLQWQTKAYELYEIQSTTNPASGNWSRYGNPVIPLSATGAMANVYAPSAPRQFFRVVKVP